MNAIKTFFRNLHARITAVVVSIKDAVASFLEKHPKIDTTVTVVNMPGMFAMLGMVVGAIIGVIGLTTTSPVVVLCSMYVNMMIGQFIGSLVELVVRRDATSVATAGAATMTGSVFMTVRFIGMSMPVACLTTYALSIAMFFSFNRLAQSGMTPREFVNGVAQKVGELVGTYIVTSTLSNFYKKVADKVSAASTGLATISTAKALWLKTVLFFERFGILSFGRRVVLSFALLFENIGIMSIGRRVLAVGHRVLTTVGITKDHVSFFSRLTGRATVAAAIAVVTVAIIAAIIKPAPAVVVAEQNVPFVAAPAEPVVAEHVARNIENDNSSMVIDVTGGPVSAEELAFSVGKPTVDDTRRRRRAIPDRNEVKARVRNS